MVIQRPASPIAGGAAALLAAGVLAACGSTSSSSASRSSSSGAGDGRTARPAVVRAKAEFVKFHAVQPPLAIPVLPKRPPSGLRLTLTTCPLPVCLAATNPAAAAAKLLGWKVRTIQAPYTPEGYQTAWNQALQQPTDLIAASAVVPNSFISKQLAVVAQRKTPLVMFVPPAGDTPTSNGPLLAGVVGPPQFAQDGRLMADAVIADANTGPSTVWITDPAVVIFKPAQTAFTQTVTTAGGHVDELDVSLAGIGKTVPGQVVSYVQAHPNVKYLAFALDDLTIGVPQALKAAGAFDGVKIVSRAPQPANLAAIKAGDEWASVADDDASAGYRAIDQLARIVERVPLGDLRDPAGWGQILTKDNITETTAPPAPLGLPGAFLKAWHLQ
jgi:ribose transport system substrate-binding protein